MLYPKLKSSVQKFTAVKHDVIDGPIFNMHCKLTAVMLFIASTIVSTQMNVGKPIQCISNFKNGHKVVEMFCWINSTFRLLPKMYNNSESYAAETYHYIPRSSDRIEEIHYAYYQWVGFILFFQGMLFYAPKWYWKLSEGKLMKGLLGADDKKLEDEEERRRKSRILAQYFTERLKGSHHHYYTTTYWLLECLCLCNVIFQLKAIDKFLGGNGRFLSYGFKFSFADLGVVGLFEKFYELDYVFPLQTKCTFLKYGPSGTLQQMDALCILFLNFYNRYIFAVMWYWFSLLLLLLALLLIYRVLLINSSWLRAMHLRTPGNRTLDRETKAVVLQLPVSDWWVLYMLKANIDVVQFREIISELFCDVQASQRRD